MGWVFAIGMALMALGALILIGRAPRASWEIAASALLLGLAGYAWQGRPALAGNPREPASAAGRGFDEEAAARRRAIGERMGPAGQWLMLSDGLGRQGKTKESANVLLAGLRDRPRDPNLWLGLGNALVAHGGGIVSPSAAYAFRQAIRIDPAAPAAPYFYGLALAESGDLAGARKLWAPIAERAPADSAIRAELLANIAQIDAMLAGGAGAGGPPPR